MKKLAEIKTSQMRVSLSKSNISIGEYSYGNPKIIVYNDKVKLSIGKFCSIASDVTIMLGGNHALNWSTTFPFTTLLGIKNNRSDEKQKVEEAPKYKDTVIGNDVWIGYGALILSGVKIGDGSIIGAKAVVAKDVEPYSIVAGNPAKLIRYRYSEEIRNSLLEKKWWDLADERIEELLPLLLQPNIHKLLDKL